MKPAPDRNDKKSLQKIDQKKIAALAADLQDAGRPPIREEDIYVSLVGRYDYTIFVAVGQDLVEEFVRRENPDGDEEGDWQALAKLLSYPPTPMLLTQD